MFSSTGNMSADVRDSYLKLCNQLMFEVFETEIAFREHYDLVVTSFTKFPAAVKFLKSLWDDREKICATFTANHFTAGHVASQRAESNNSRIKERGDSKDDFKTFIMHQILDHLFGIIRHQEFAALKELNSMVQDGKSWSKFVDDKWHEQLVLANSLACSPLLNRSENQWSAKRHDGKGVVHLVTLKDLAEPLHIQSAFARLSHQL